MCFYLFLFGPQISNIFIFFNSVLAARLQHVLGGLKIGILIIIIIFFFYSVLGARLQNGLRGFVVFHIFYVSHIFFFFPYFLIFRYLLYFVSSVNVCF